MSDTIPSETEVNVYQSGQQLNPDITTLENGGYVVVWWSQDQDGSGWGGYAQIYDASGSKVGTEFRVNETTVGDQRNVMVSSLENGEIVVSWSSDHSGNFDIYARRFAADGTALGSEFLVNTTTSDDQRYTDITSLSDGGFMVTWSDTNSIYGQRYSADGTTSGSQFTIDSGLTNDGTYETSITETTDGGVVVIWSTLAINTSNIEVYGQRFDASGNEVGSEFVVNTDTAGGQGEARVASLTDGGFVVSWSSEEAAGGKWDILVQRYDQNGNAVGGVMTANEDNIYSQRRSSVVGLPDGGFVVSWTTNDGQDGSVRGIYAQRFDSAGLKMGDEFLVPGLTEHNQAGSVVDVLSDGRLVFTWQTEALSDGANYDVVTKIFDTGINNAPELSDSVINLPSAQTVSHYFSAHDVDGDNLTFELASGPANGTVTLNSDGTYSYDPEGFVGTDSFTYRVTDEHGGVSEASVSINIANTSDTGEVYVGDGDSRVQTSILNLPDGGYTILWTGIEETAGNYSLRLQHYDVDGNATGGQIVANTTHSTSDIFRPELRLIDDGYIAVWQSMDQSNVFQVKTQKFDFSGNKIGSENTVSSNALHSSSEALSDGGYIITWMNTGYDVFAQRYDSTGTAVGSQISIASNTSGTQQQPKAAELSNGDIIFSWTSDEANGNHVYSRRLQSNGSMGAAEQVDQSSTGPAYVRNILALQDGSYVIAGFEDTATTQRDSFIRHYDASGNATGDAIPVHETLSGSQQGIELAELSSGGFVAVWISDEDGDYEVYGRVFSANGQPIGDEIQINMDHAEFQGATDVTVLDDGRIAVVWRHMNADGSQEVRHRIIGEDVFFSSHQIDGVEGNDILTGGTGDDAINGNAGNDLLKGGAGADNLDGGDGTDIAAYDGTIDGYQLTNNGDGTYTLQDIDPSNGDDGTDTLTNIEQIIFADHDIALDGRDNYTPINSGPVTASTDEDVAITVTQAELLANASDIDGDTLSVSNLVVSGSDATIADNGDGTWTITPTENYNGDISISYDVSDGTDTVAGSLDLTVTPVNDAPVISGPISATTDEDTSITVTSAELLANATDVEGDALSVSNLVVSGSDATIVDNGDGTWTITPALDYNGDISISYDVSDGADTVTGSLDLTVLGQLNAHDEEQVNSTTLNRQIRPKVTELVGGGYVIAWTSDADGVNDTDGYFQVYDANGDKVGGETLLNVYRVNRDEYMGIDATSDGGFVITYGNHGDLDGSGFGVFTRRFDASGQALDAQDVQVNETTIYNQVPGDVTVLDDGSYVVVWLNGEDAQSSKFDIYMQRYSSDGTKLGGETAIAQTTSANQNRVNVTSLATGGFVVGWGSDASGEFESLIRVFNTDGTALTGETAFTTSLNGDFSGDSNNVIANMDVVALSDGGFIAVVEGQLTGEGTPSLYAHRFDANGALQGQAFELIPDSDGAWHKPRLTAIEDGGFAAVWSGVASGESDSDIYVQLFNGDGTARSSVLRVNDVTVNDQTLPEISTLEDGRLVVTWESAGQDGDQGGIYHKIVGLNDFPIISGPVELSTDEDTSITVTTAELLANATDVEGDALSVDNLVVAGSDATIVDNGDGTWTITPATDYNGDISISYDVSDGTDTVAGSLDLTVTPVNDAPVISGSISATTNEDTSITVTSAQLLANASDVEGDALSVSNLVVVGSDATIVDNGDGTWTITPALDYNGDISISYDVSDGTDTVAGSLDLTVLGQLNAHDEDIVNSNLIAGHQQKPDITSLVGGGYVVTWESDASGDSDVYGRVYDANGQAIGSEFLLSNYQNNDQVHADVTALPDGGFEVTWMSVNQAPDGSGWGVFKRSFDAQGVAQDSTEELVNTYTYWDQNDPTPVNLESGGYVIVWHSRDQNTTAWDLYGQRYDVNGDPVGGETLLFGKEGTQHRLSATALANGGYVVAWNTHETGHNSLMIFSDDGTALTPEIEYTAPINGVFTDSSILSLPDGGFVVAVAGDVSGDQGVYVQHYDANGVAQTPLELLYANSTSSKPSLTRTSDGGYALVWQGDMDGASDLDIYVQIFNASGEATSTRLRVNDITVGDQTAPVISTLEDGRLVVTWVSDQGDGSEGNIHHKIVGLNDFPIVSGPVELSTDEDVSITVTTAELLANTTDVEGDTLSVDNLVVAGSDATIVDNGDGTWTITPTENYNGDISISYDVSDGTDTVAGSLDLTVTPVNDAPVISGSISATTNEDTSITVTSAQLLANASDVEGDALSVSNLVVVGSDATIVDNGDGTWTITPALDYNGDISISYDVSDGTDTVAGSLDLTVLGQLNAHDEDIVNSNLIAGHQQKPDITSLVGGGYVVTWESDASGDSDVYGRVYDANGQAIGSEFLLSNYQNNDQVHADVTALPDGGFEVTWMSVNQAPDGSGWGVFKRSFDAQGVAQDSTEELVNTYTYWDQNDPTPVNLESGGYVIVWHSRDQNTTAWDLYGQRYDVNGDPVGGETLLFGKEGTQHRLSATALANGGYVVAWNTHETGHNSLMIFSDDGTALTPEIEYTAPINGVFTDSSILSLPDGGFVVAVAGDVSGDQGVYVQHYDANGVAQTPLELLYANSTSSKPSLTRTSDGGYALVWQGDMDGASDLDIYVQIFNASGEATSTRLRVNDITVGDQTAPVISTLEDGRLVVTWVSDQGDGSEGNIHHKIVGLNDFPIVSGPVELSTDEDVSITVTTAELLANTTDVEGDTLSVDNLVVAGSDATIVDNGDGTWTITPTENYNGDISISYDVSDGTDTVAGSLDLTVTPVNDAPVISGSISATTNEDTSITVTSAQLLANASDVEGDALSVSNLVVVGSDATIVDNGDGTWTITPALDYNGDISISYDVSDGTDTVAGSLDLTVLGQLNAHDEEQVNSTTLNRQIRPKVTELVGGGYVIAWTSDADGVNDTDGYFQVYDANGDKVGGETLLNVYRVNRDEYMGIDATSDGGFVITYGNHGDLDGSGFGVFTRRFDASGQALDAQDVQVNETTIYNQVPGDVTVLDDGSYVVVWLNGEDAQSSKFDIYMQRYSADGTKLGGETAIAQTTSANQNRVNVTSLATGGFVVGWGSDASGEFESLIRVFNTDGTALTGETAFTTSLNGDFSGDSNNAIANMDVVALTDGGFIAVVEGQLTGEGTPSLYAHRFDANGALQGQAFELIPDSDGAWHKPRLTAIEDGGFAAVWSGVASGESDSDIYVQLFNGDGTARSSVLRVNDVTVNDQTLPEISTLEDGRLVVTWESAGQDGDQGGIYHKIVGLNDFPIISGPVELSTDEDVSITVTTVELLANATDVEGDTLSVSNLVVSGSDATIVDNGDGTWTITPATDYNGDISISYDVSDGTDTVAGSLDLTVTPVNDAPVISGPISATTNEDTSVTVTSAELLANATDVEGDALSVSNLVVASSDATIVDNGDGTWTITPALDYNGDISISYDVSDGTETVVRALDLTVTPVNDAPTAEGGKIVLNGSEAASWKLHGHDVDGDNLTFSGIDETGVTVVEGASFTTENGGAVTINADGTYSYQAASGYKGEDSFTYQVTDEHGLSNTSIMQISIDSNTPRSEELVNSLTLNDQLRSKIAPLSNGDYVIVWQSEEADGNSHEIYMQRYDAYGNPKGLEQLVNSVTSQNQYNATVKTLANGNYVVGWTSSEQNGGSLDVFAKIYDAEGQIVVDEFMINAFSTSNIQQYLNIVPLSEGGFIATWNDNNADSDISGVYAQRFNDSGEPVHPSGELLDITGDVVSDHFTVNDYEALHQTPEGGIATEDGGYILVWRSRNQDGSMHGVYHKKYDADGNAVTPEILVNTYTSDTQSDSDIALLDNGEYVIVWRSKYQDGSAYGIYGQRFDSSNNKLGNEFRVNTTSAGDQQYTRVSSFKDGSFIVTWHSSGQDGDGNGVYAQLYDTSGNAIGGEFLVNDITVGTQMYPDVTVTTDGSYVLTWSSVSADGTFDIKQKIFSSNLLLDGTNGNDVLEGDIGHDNMAGNLGDDLLKGQAGDDIIDGGAGDDVAVYDGAITDFNFTKNADGSLIIEDTNSEDGDEGTDIISNVEELRFGDGTIVELNDVNNAPIITAPVSLETDEDTAITVTSAELLANAIDVDGDALNISNLVVSGSDAIVVDNGDGTWIITPAENYNGDVSISYDVSDGTDTVSGGLDLTVTPVNDAPIVSDGEIKLNTAQSVSHFVSAYDIEGDNFTFELVSGPTNGTLIFNSDGTYTYTPNSFSGYDSFVVRAVDEFGAVSQEGVISVFVSDGTEEIVDSITSSDRVTPVVSALDNGGYVLVWDTVADGSDTGVVAQIFDRNGEATSTVLSVNSTTSQKEMDPSVTTLSDGSFVITWQASYNSNVSHIYSQRFDAQGNKLGTEQIVSGSEGNSSPQVQSEVVALSSGGYVVLWKDHYDDSDGSDGMRARIFNADGTSVSSEIIVNEVIAGDSGSARVAELANGNIVFGWHNSGTDGSGHGAYIRIFDASGVALTATQLVNDATDDNQVMRDVTVLSDGRFIVSFFSNSSTATDRDMIGQLYDSSGAKIGSNFDLTPDHLADNQNDGLIVATDDGGFFVIYSSDGDLDGDGQGVFVQRFDSNMATMGDPLQVNETTIYDQRVTGADLLDDGRLVVAMRYSENASGTDQQVVTRILGADGNFIHIDGSSGDDVLVGSDFNDQIAGGAGNDLLSGGTGDDIYQFSKGDDHDIIDNDDVNAASSTDKIVFGTDIDEADIWFRQDGDDLIAQILGTDDQLTISDWFDNSSVNYQAIDQFEVSDGSVLTASNVQSLVDAMSSFTVDQITNDTIESNSDHDDAQNVIAATWT